MKQRNYSITLFWNSRDMDLKTKQSTISLTVKFHGNKSTAPDDYVFPVLVKDSSLLKQEADKWR